MLSTLFVANDRPTPSACIALLQKGGESAAIVNREKFKGLAVCSRPTSVTDAHASTVGIADTVKAATLVVGATNGEAFW